MKLIKVVLAVAGLSVCVGCGGHSEVESSCDFSFDPDLLTYRHIDYDPVFSPSGMAVAYIRKDAKRRVWALETIDLLTSKQTQVICGSFSSPSWSPDASWVVVSGGQHLFKIFPEMPDSLLQLTFDGLSFNPSCSPNGDRILFSKYYDDRDFQHLNGIWMMESDGTNGEQLLYSQFILQPSWAPSNDKFLFFVEDSLYVYDLAGRERSLLMRTPHSGWEAKFSPDGGRIVYVQFPVGIKPDIWLADSLGGASFRLTTTGALHPAWSPDGSSLVFTDIGETGRLWTLNLSTMERKQLTRK